MFVCVFQALENLTANLEVVENVAEVGGIQILGDAMRAHQDHIGIQEESAAAFRNLCVLERLRDMVCIYTAQICVECGA